jgi:hypothetical protein
MALAERASTYAFSEQMASWRIPVEHGRYAATSLA